MRMETNAVRILCGPRGQGKTTLARQLVRQALDGGRRVYVHDPGDQFKTLCDPYRNVEEWRAKARDAAKSNRSISHGARFAEDNQIRKQRDGREFVTTELIQLADELGKRYNTASSARWPITLVFDEGALLGQGNWVAQGLNELLAQARHRQVEMILLCQRRAQLSVAFWEMASDVYVFRQPSGSSRELERPLCCDAGSLGFVTQLQPHRYAHVVQGQGPSEAKL